MRGIAIRSCGLVTSVGQSAPATCAAIRAKVSNPSETRFTDGAGAWITAHHVALARPWHGLPKLAKMGAMAIAECLAPVECAQWGAIPLLLCAAEVERAGRVKGQDQQLYRAIEAELGASFAPASAIIPHGRVSAAIALAQAIRLIDDGSAEQVLVAATDSLLSAEALAAFASAGRLLTPDNSNGFIPGEGGGAILLGRAGAGPQLRCSGVGFGVEAASLASDQPLRADGLRTAILSALEFAKLRMCELDFRITDLSGEQYYFKEASLALTRTLRERKEQFDIWHPAETIGETGAVAGVAVLVLAQAACLKAYAPGPRLLVHMGSDDGRRAAAVLEYGDAR
jgi:3-oxoacyl-[acyl-carrier-protein] synthase-1